RGVECCLCVEVGVGITPPRLRGVDALVALPAGWWSTAIACRAQPASSSTARPRRAGAGLVRTSRSVRSSPGLSRNGLARRPVRRPTAAWYAGHESGDRARPTRAAASVRASRAGLGRRVRGRFSRLGVANGDASADTVRGYRSQLSAWVGWCGERRAPEDFGYLSE